MIFRASWLTLGMFSAALAGGATPPQTPPLLTWFSLFLVRSSANFAKKIQELAEDKAENPRTCRGQSREENPYERLQENSNLQAFFFQAPFLIATLPTPKTLGGGTPPRGASIKSAAPGLPGSLACFRSSRPPAFRLLLLSPRPLHIPPGPATQCTPGPSGGLLGASWPP